jgi:hypothetical protein
MKNKEVDLQIFCNRCHKEICKISLIVKTKEELRGDLTNKMDFRKKIEEKGIGIWTYPGRKGTEMNTYHKECLEELWKEFKKISQDKTKSQKEILQEIL